MVTFRTYNFLIVSLALMALVAWVIDPALAAESAGHASDSHDSHGGGSAGLPQFDPSTFSSQVFWLTIAFVLSYFYFSKKTLPEISSVLEGRREHIEEDLSRAEKIREEAETAQRDYESLLQDARQKSMDLTAAALNTVKEKAEKHQAEFRKKSVKDIEDVEKRLEKEKQNTMKDMTKIAAEIASEAAEKIVGIKADLKQAQTVVKSLNEREAA